MYDMALHQARCHYIGAMSEVTKSSSFHSLSSRSLAIVLDSASGMRNVALAAISASGSSSSSNLVC